MSEVDLAGQVRILEGPEATARLLELGIPPEALDAALDAGDVAARQADEFSPVMAAGMLRWLETVRMLRQRLAAEGWSWSDHQNSPRALSPSGSIAVAALTGTAGTGLRVGRPRASHPRGAVSARAVQLNGQLGLDLGPELSAGQERARKAEPSTYHLLYHRAQDDELRAELSLFDAMTAQGVLINPRERILLPPRRFGAPEVLPRDAGGSDEVEFDIASR
jgi:hypothetical protein